jgi:hypothetical protein
MFHIHRRRGGGGANAANGRGSAHRSSGAVLTSHTVPRGTKDTAPSVESLQPDEPQRVVGRGRGQARHLPVRGGERHDRGRNDPDPSDSAPFGLETAHEAPGKRHRLRARISTHQNGSGQRARDGVPELDRSGLVDLPGKLPANVVGVEKDRWSGCAQAGNAPAALSGGSTPISSRHVGQENAPGHAGSNRPVARNYKVFRSGQGRSTPALGRGSVASAALAVLVVALFLAAGGVVLLGPSAYDSAGRPGQATAPRGPVASWANFSSVIYFNETGLPGGTSWSVTANGAYNSSNGPSISFLVLDYTNVCYSFGGVAGYVTPSSGCDFVQSSNQTLPIFWAATTYQVQFTESGLPYFTQWSVTFNGSYQAAYGSAVSFLSPNGTFNYTIGSVTGYSASPGSGSVTVSGGAASVAVSFGTVAYVVSFQESGLPAGTSWSVSLNGAYGGSTTSTITYNEGNGTLPFTIGSIVGYIASPASGSVVVNGTQVSESISFVPATYSVTFTETGLPGGSEWDLVLAGQTSVGSTSSTASILLLNGSYSYSIVSANSEYAPSPRTGDFTVSGHALDESVNFTLVASLVAFRESGLPRGVDWYLNVSGQPSVASNTSAAGIHLPNGTYSFSIASTNKEYGPDPAGGQLTVAGQRINESVTFTLEVYPLSFAESGLPVGTPWTVELGGVQPWTSTTAWINLTHANATDLTYSFLAVPGFEPDPARGEILIAGLPVTVAISYTVAMYSVEFNSSGLPYGSSWSVNLSGSFHPSKQSIISFAVPNGTYPFDVNGEVGWAPTPRSDSVTVAGANMTVPIGWTVESFSITFQPLGLPAGTTWGVLVDGVLETNQSGPIVFGETNGTYSYTLSPISGLVATPASGTLHIRGQDVTQFITWSLPAGSVVYPLVFAETGLPSVSYWAVSFDGVAYTPQNVSLTLNVPNGTYPFSVTALDSYLGNPESGWLTVNGSALSLVISFDKPRSTFESLVAVLPYALAAFVGLVLAIVLISTLVRRRRDRRPAAPTPPPPVAFRPPPPPPNWRQ